MPSIHIVLSSVYCVGFFFLCFKISFLGCKEYYLLLGNLIKSTYLLVKLWSIFVTSCVSKEVILVYYKESRVEAPGVEYLDTNLIRSYKTLSLLLIFIYAVSLIEGSFYKNKNKRLRK